MPRWLVMTEYATEGAARDQYVRALTERRAKVANTGANFWVFEEDSREGTFVEFVEAGSESMLTDALHMVYREAGVAAPHTPSRRVWRELRDA